MSEPCKCHQSFAAVIPRHDGHCCFFPASQRCHPDEVAEWRRQAQLRGLHPTPDEPARTP